MMKLAYEMREVPRELTASQASWTEFDKRLRSLEARITQLETVHANVLSSGRENGAKQPARRGRPRKSESQV